MGFWGGVSKLSLPIEEWDCKNSKQGKMWLTTTKMFHGFRAVRRPGISQEEFSLSAILCTSISAPSGGLSTILLTQKHKLSALPEVSIDLRKRNIE